MVRSSLVSSVPLLSLLCLAPLGCKEAKGTDVDPRLLVPGDADVVMGFSLDPVRQSPLGPMLGTAMRSDHDMSSAMDATSKCVTDLSALRGFVATQMDADDKIFGVVQSPGIGDESVVRCIEDAMREADGEKGGIILFETRGDVRITPQEGGGYLIILNKDAIAMVDGPWEDKVFAAIEQPASRNSDSPLAKAMAGMDAGAHLWVAATLDESDVADLGDVPGATAIRSVVAALDLASGIGIDVDLGFTDAEQAGAFEEALPAMMEEIGPSLPEAGLPADLLEGLKIEGEGTVVSTKLQIAGDAVPGVLTTMMALASE
ncbi:hypothetical protein [Paraliomyxa miuraensis]|uniref:hypothetical protein n=1 Tax=Paraliomyxa miuraensis TaxID=376150 RepID=UPI002250C24B|nr:hypothetical protein [Paraliomyxa miuraensis]MCX4240422.1 hypothetical protein [Paraliomyxa miuraensis]